MIGLGLAIPQVAARRWGGVTPTPTPSAYQTLLQRFIDTYAAAVAVATMAAAPAFSIGGDYGGSTINGGAGWPNQATILPTALDPAACQWAIKGNDGGYDWYTAAYITVDGGLKAPSRGNWLVFQLAAGETQFDFSIYRYNFDGPRGIQLRVNGQWASATDYIFDSASHQNAYCKFTGLPAGALVELYFGLDVAIFGLNATAGKTLTPITYPAGDLQVVALGDSLVAGQTSDGAGVRQGLFAKFGEALGIRNIVLSGVGGQGYVTSIGSNTIKSRVITGGDLTRFPNANMIVMYGSTNDGAAAVATMQQNAQDTLAGACASHPNAVKLCLSSFDAVGSALDATRNTAMLNAWAAAADERTIIVDLRTFLPQIQGNSSDHIHPTKAECATIAPSLAAHVVDRMRASV